MRWRLQWMESSLLPAMNVLSLCVGLAMNMREEKAIRLALSVKPDISVSKVKDFVCSLLFAYLLNMQFFKFLTSDVNCR
jgi:hypothetical protein